MRKLDHIPRVLLRTFCACFIGHVVIFIRYPYTAILAHSKAQESRRVCVAVVGRYPVHAQAWHSIGYMLFRIEHRVYSALCCYPISENEPTEENAAILFFEVCDVVRGQGGIIIQQEFDAVYIDLRVIKILGFQPMAGSIRVGCTKHLCAFGR